MKIKLQQLGPSAVRSISGTIEMPSRKNIALNRKIDFVNLGETTVDEFESIDLGGFIYHYKYFPQPSDQQVRLGGIPKRFNEYAIGYYLDVESSTSLSTPLSFTVYHYDPTGYTASGEGLASLSLDVSSPGIIRGQVMRSAFLTSGGIGNPQEMIQRQIGYYGVLIGDDENAAITFNKFHVYFLYS